MQLPTRANQVFQREVNLNVFFAPPFGAQGIVADFRTRVRTHKSALSCMVFSFLSLFSLFFACFVLFWFLLCSFISSIVLICCCMTKG